ncbi:MAG: YceI family protein [Actinomycetota bacterium]|nr:YceI family protein [Actinomycetota bacterium]
MSTDTNQIAAGTWTIDPAHSEVGFTVRHLMSKVRGQFEKFEGTVTTGGSLGDTRAEATIDLSSVNTREPQRDNHLRSSDFFGVETADPMTFKTTAFDGTTATGELTLNKVTKPVELSVEYLGQETDPWGGSRIGFEATTEINRKDFGVDFNIPLDGGRLLIGDKVSIQIAVEAVLNPS